LLVAKHPESVQKHDQWSPLEFLERILGKSVVQTGWLLHFESQNVSLTNILVEEVQSSNGEQDWHSNSVHHGHEDDVQDVGVLEVDHVVLATVEIDESVDGSLLGLVEGA
jgi:hypothetical protein